MSHHDSDDERVAAFLDGRMDARRREQMLDHLIESEEDREVLIGAAAILHELEEEDAALADAGEVEGTAVIPLDSRRPQPQPAVRRTRARLVGGLLLAASVAGIALVSTRALQNRGSADEPLQVAARLERGGEGLPAGWTEQRPWATVRGDAPAGAPTPAERSARSARAGAMLVDLAVAVQARDSAATRVLATQLAARFDPEGGRAAPLGRIVAEAGADPAELRPLIGEATERIEERLDADALRLGAWTEAAGLAAARRDAAFFRDGETRRALDRATQLTADDAPARTALDRVRPLAAGDPPRWEELASALDALARELASE